MDSIGDLKLRSSAFVTLIADVHAVSGDLNIVGRFYAGNSEQGVVYCDVPDSAGGT